MRIRAKITSKGQITVPAEIRATLGVGAGDYLAFETKQECVSVEREPSVHEYLERLRSELRIGPARYESDDEAIAALFRGMTDEEIHGGDTLYLITPAPHEPGHGHESPGREGGGER